jgi:transcriptional regulator with XRE-family HTH domain
MDVPLLIKHRLEELGLEQRDLANAAQVTESYISQLLGRKKAPPASNRTDIYDKMEKILNLRSGELARLADLDRQEDSKRKLAEPPKPLLKEVRELVLCKCKPDKREQIKAIFQKQPFGEFERLVTQKLLDVVKRIAKSELENENWLHLAAKLSNHTYEDIRVAILEFLDTDVFDVSIENCVAFLNPLIESWDIDLKTFAMEIILNRRMAPGHPQKFEYVEKEPEPADNPEPGFSEFLKDALLCGTATEEEVNFLKKLRFRGRHPTPLYYYRELQNLRDPLHFQKVAAPAHVRKRKVRSKI